METQKSTPYIGVKLLKNAVLITAKQAKDAGFKIGNSNEEDLGYEVTYEDGYTSWSPKEVFDKAYRPIDGLTFGLAIEALKKGEYVCRQGWNGKGMYLFIIGINIHEIGLGGWTYTNGKNDNYSLLPFIAMKTVDRKVVPWLASQTDVLAEDWMVIDNK